MASSRDKWFAAGCCVHTNTKVLDLAQRLKLDVDTTVGKLCRLWAWAKMLDIEDGNIGRLPAQEIADIMRWRKNANTLVDTMLELRFLERGEDGAFLIHGWYELNGKPTEKARKDRERKGKEAG